MGITITAYNILCNLGNDIDEVFNNSINGETSCFNLRNDIIQSQNIRIGTINCTLPEINNEIYNLRCNKVLLKGFEKLDIKKLTEKYSRNRIGIVTATTNTGVQEFEASNNKEQTKISNPAKFIKEYFGLNNYHTCVSTACSSGMKAFSIACELLNSNFSDAVIVASVDTIAKVPLYGFNSLEILTNKPTNPFSKNRCGINIGEGAGIFILEKDVNEGIAILGIGETTDFYHSTTPDPNAVEAVNAIEKALEQASLTYDKIDYINLHGTGTLANDLMEGTAINKIFGEKIPASSTKPLTGHCLGAAAGIEAGLCCKLIDSKSTSYFPHIYDGEYDLNIPKINLVKKEDLFKPAKNILCTSFGFGGTNTAIILGEIS